MHDSAGRGAHLKIEGGTGKALTVEAFVDLKHCAAERLQVAVAQWELSDRLENFAAFDAAEITGPQGMGFFGAVFDGRYIYFCPMQYAREEFHGRVLRYDTQKDFADSSSYEVYEAGCTGGLDTRGYYGGAFNGRYVYFVPRKTASGRHSRVLRYDTRQAFKNEGAWSVYDAGLSNCRQGVAFDGRFLYFAPGYDDAHPSSETIPSNRVLRLDTQADFHQAASWQSVDPGPWLDQPCGCYDGAAYDGRYVYFAPLLHETVLRYDTELAFDQPKAWQVRTVPGLGANVGAIFDGRFLYFAAYGHDTMVRLDTRGDFAAEDAWESMALGAHFAGRLGFDGGFYDGRYVHFVPFIAVEDGRPNFHTNFARYDTRQSFTSAQAWQFQRASPTHDQPSSGYNAGAFDGRYFYCAPWRDPEANPQNPLGLHATILRYDTAGEPGRFVLKAGDCGHNGGLCAAAPGPSFLIQTENGLASVTSSRVLTPGRHHLAGTYDGRTIRLYVDGCLEAERAASGRLVASALPVTVGRMACGSAVLDGVVIEAEVTGSAKNPAEIAGFLDRASASAV